MPVASMARRLVLDVQAGKPIGRRDSVALARAVLESDPIRGRVHVSVEDVHIILNL